MRKVYGWTAGLAVVLVAGLALAQEVRDPAAPARPGARPGADRPATAERAAPGDRAGAATNMDQQIAACLLTGCRNEVAIARFAEPKLSEEAKQFAAKLIQDHEASCKMLEPLAGNLAQADAGADRARPGADRAAARPDADADSPDRATARPRGAASAGGKSDWVSIHQEIAAQCLASSKEELESKDGAEFDKCFIGMQVAGHMHMLDQLKVLKNHTSGELNQHIEKTTPVVQSHLTMAKSLMEDQKGVEGKRLSTRPDAPRAGARPATPRPDATPKPE